MPIMREQERGCSATLKGSCVFFSSQLMCLCVCVCVFWHDKLLAFLVIDIPSRKGILRFFWNTDREEKEECDDL